MSTRIFIFFLLLLPHSTYAGEVPTELFGVTLGMTATRTQDNPAGEMTIKRLTGLVPWSRGPRYYYEPEQASEAFPYMISAIIIGVLQCNNDIAVVRLRQPLLNDGRPCYIATQAFKPLALTHADGDRLGPMSRGLARKAVT